MSALEKRPNSFLTFTLHAHLPYVVNHGTWPHGIEWLHEAAAETYLPLLGVLGRLERDGVGLHCNLNISPILLEQLAHPVFLQDFPRYLDRKIQAAREDEAFFHSMGQELFAETARFWNRFFTQALEQFEALGRDIIAGFRHFDEAGLIEIITCGATHGYMPLLGTDESVRAQIRTAVQTHSRHIGRPPRGIWVPECGYRPAGLWSFPVANADGSPAAAPFERIGVEQALAESEIDYFFVDTHLVEESARVLSPYADMAATAAEISAPRGDRRLYQPYFVGDQQHSATVFARDPRTGFQVWSGEFGYPGDGLYLDFHKKRWPGGHRYWKVTGSSVDMDHKLPYEPEQAAARTLDHAHHFVHLVRETLRQNLSETVPPILCSPFDAELFGHWWFEGPLWLEAVARAVHSDDRGLALIDCSRYLEQYPRAGFISMHEGSWGAEGANHVWMNPETSWTYTHIYPAELYLREVCTQGRWRETALGERVVKQLCRELLLLESSDWQFLITTGAARDYAELRFDTHNRQFLELKAIWQTLDAGALLADEQMAQLVAIEERDSIFADIDPGFWALGAHETSTTGLQRSPTGPAERA